MKIKLTEQEAELLINLINKTIKDINDSAKRNSLIKFNSAQTLYDLWQIKNKITIKT